MAASLVRSAFEGVRLLKFLRPVLIPSTVSFESIRGVKRYKRSYLKELYHRRLEVGPEKQRHRSEWINWNYGAELYAFGKRLGEDFSTDSLQRAFTHRSYIEKEERRREELGIDTDTVPLGLTDNEDLAQKGEATASRYIKTYLRHLYPAMFEEAVYAIHDHLMSEDTLSFVARNIGIGDLMLCADFPPEASSLRRNFLAVVGALEADQDVKQAEALVRDLVVAQLIGKDLGDLWTVVNPMGLLMALLHLHNRGPPEPRLQWQAGQMTVMSVYQVGIYSDQQLVGQAAGETVTIAEEMAAHNALQKLMGLGSKPLAFQAQAEKMELDYSKENMRAEDVLKRFETAQKQNSVV
ncbi:large ribosomal subunit protein mL44-like [Babylonia areolata]|uniref:large ribosomal subunit protein mL44-like n=1 Tax=Babylonia areolata TaxID=304850 RepID=UPI003FD58531